MQQKPNNQSSSRKEGKRIPKTTINQYFVEFSDNEIEDENIKENENNSKETMNEDDPSQDGNLTILSDISETLNEDNEETIKEVNKF